MTNAYTSWDRFWEGAACAGVDTNIFFSPDVEEIKLTRVQQTVRDNAAKRICASCPIKARCRNWAITRDEKGVWGGLTEKERIQRQKVAKQFLTPKSRSKLYL